MPGTVASDRRAQLSRVTHSRIRRRCEGARGHPRPPQAAARTSPTGTRAAHPSRWALACRTRRAPTSPRMRPWLRQAQLGRLRPTAARAASRVRQRRARLPPRPRRRASVAARRRARSQASANRGKTPRRGTRTRQGPSCRLVRRAPEGMTLTIASTLARGNAACRVHDAPSQGLSAAGATGTGTPHSALSAASSCASGSLPHTTPTTSPTIDRI